MNERRQFDARGGRIPPSRYTGPSSGQQNELPAGYLKNGYFDDKGNIFPELITIWAKDIAIRIAEGMETTQLRRFFSEARRLEGQLNAGKDFAAVRGDILKLDSYAADALKKRKVTQLFKSFMEMNTKLAAKDNKSFLNGFIPHFECVVAYFPKK